jgi:lysophospholipase L1-like esterase
MLQGRQSRSPASSSRGLARAGGALLFAIAALVCLEAAIELLLRYPQAAPSLFRPAAHINHLKNYYLRLDRSIVQYRTDCATSDPVLIYRLRPGSCTVRNRESTVTYTVNRAGLRDTDTKLAAPEIIVLGDSLAMGWGVAQAQTLSERLAALTGRNVLNAAISSYETVREMALLRELVRPQTEYVVIVYCGNDYAANWALASHGGVLSGDLAAYDAAVRQHAQAVPYYPLKHVWHLGGLIKEFLADPPAARLAVRADFAAMTFLAILDGQRDLLRGRHLIVFDVNGYNQNNSLFTDTLRAAAGHSPLLKDLTSLDVIDASTILSDDDYFLIDDHMTASGHDKMARVVAEIVAGSRRWQVPEARAATVPDARTTGSGNVEAVEQKGALTFVSGWAARGDTGQPPVSVALLRDDVRLVEAGPVFARPDVAAALKTSAASLSGYGLAVGADRLREARRLELVAIWADGSVTTLADDQRLRPP